MGIKRKIVGFEMVDRGIPRTQYDVLANGEKIGYVTSGSFSPSLEINIGMALIDPAFSEPGLEVDIAIRNRATKARIVELPFYSKKYAKG